MNEFTAKKLGEVLAFSRIGAETIAKGQAALESVLGNTVSEATKTLNEHASAIETSAKNANMLEITTTKAEATGKKLRAMRDMYVGDQWDNPAELLEWLGFFEGAAVVHWELVAGAAETLHDDALKSLAISGRDFHSNLLDSVCTAIKQVGRTKASA